MPAIAWPASFTRKINWIRVTFHILGGLFTASLMWLFTGEGTVKIGLVFAGLALILEMARRRFPHFRQSFQDAFGILMKPKERYGLTGFTWVVAGALLVAFFVREREAATLAYLAWAFGDASAVVFGTLIPSARITANGKKTLSGALFGLLAVAVVSYMMLTNWHSPDILKHMGILLGVFFLTETFSASLNLDDNLTIPVSIALALSLL
jgi:dolichol kinase